MTASTTTGGGARAKAALAAFTLALFLSALAMFAVQPMAGKMLLPLVGGAPSGWLVAMAFFQTMLLAGYVLAHLLSRFSPRGHALAYIAVLCGGLLFLPPDIARHAGGVDGLGTAADVFILLIVTLAVPFIALSASSSTIQRLFTVTGHVSASDPYFLYAASNLGSFGGLLLYPLAIEPFFTLTEQAGYWQAVYIVLIACAAVCLALAGRGGGAREKTARGKPMPWARRLEWVALAFFPSSLLMGVTAFITTDVVSMPLIWVVPLAIYLLTLVAAFGRRHYISLGALEALYPYGVVLVVMIGVMQQGVLNVTLWSLPTLLLVFTWTCLYFHRRLVALRPLEEDRENLTEFYLFLALGGALGGLVNAFLIPAVLERAIEFQLVLILSLALHPDLGVKSLPGRALAAVVALAFVLTYARMPSLSIPPPMMRLGLFAALALLLLLPVRRFAVPAAIVFLVAEFMFANATVLDTKRNFFGVIKVFSYERQFDGRRMQVRTVAHGTTVHGMQILSGKYRTTPTTYFSRKGALGDVFGITEPRSVGIIGLGTGTINCYSAPDRTFTFIEIDPDMIAVAHKYFTFLSECESAAPPEIVLGDGRRELAKMEKRKFDLLILDAFSSDVIPAHLLTREALALYFDRLAPGGVVTLHVSNRYFRLHPAIAATADTLGLHSRYTSREDAELEPYGDSGAWVVLARDEAALAPFDEKGWTHIDRRGMKPWTDDFTNLVGSLRFVLDRK